jgi:WD40 repeat protein
VSDAFDSSIIIYNKDIYQPDLIIKKHSGNICCIIQFNSGELVSCSYDKTIKIYNIKRSTIWIIINIKLS